MVIHLPSCRKRFPWNPEWMHLCVFLVPSSSHPHIHGPVCILIKAKSQRAIQMQFCTMPYVFNDAIFSCSENAYTSVCYQATSALYVSAVRHFKIKQKC